MKNLMLASMVLAVSPNLFAAHELGSGKQGAPYVCDDGVRDGGFSAQVSFDGNDIMTAHIYKKTKADRPLVAKGSLRPTVENEFLRAYATEDGSIQITVSFPDGQGHRSLVGRYQKDGETVQFPQVGSMNCIQEGPR